MADTYIQISQSNSTTSTATGTATVVAANPNRTGLILQSQGTGALKVLFGSGASSTNYHIVLNGGTANSDGNGGIYAMTNGFVYTGLVSIATGANVLYTVVEF